MTEHPNTTDQEQQAPPTAVEPHGPQGWSAALIALVTSPQRSFEIIRHRAPWLGVLVLLVASAASLNLLATPFGFKPRVPNSRRCSPIRNRSTPSCPRPSRRLPRDGG